MMPTSGILSFTFLPRDIWTQGLESAPGQGGFDVISFIVVDAATHIAQHQSILVQVPYSLTGVSHMSPREKCGYLVYCTAS